MLTAGLINWHHVLQAARWLVLIAGIAALVLVFYAAFTVNPKDSQAAHFQRYMRDCIAQMSEARCKEIWHWRGQYDWQFNR